MKSIAIITAALVLATPFGAQAAKKGAWAVGNDSYHLYYQDLDTKTVAGRAELLRRVESVAGRLCKEPTQSEQQQCIAQIVAGLNKPEVVAALADRTMLASR